MSKCITILDVKEFVIRINDIPFILKDKLSQIDTMKDRIYINLHIDKQNGNDQDAQREIPPLLQIK
jgi:hypothetical protein